MLSKLIVEILQEKVMYVKVHHFSYIHIKRNRLPSIPDSFYFLTAKEAVMISMEKTSIALHPRDKSLIGAFNPNRIGP